MDLLVIDEAGNRWEQPMAVSRAAKRLLLLGDPQQLPQVTQGKHPEPVKWLGTWLAFRWLQHLAAGTGLFPGSVLACIPNSAAQFQSSRTTTGSSKHCRQGTPLGRGKSGISCVFVPHTGNSSNSPEEAAEVVRQVQAHLGMEWLDPGGRP